MSAHQASRSKRRQRKPSSARPVVGMLAMLLMLPTSAIVANAQTKCPEGRTAAGECVDRGFASALRQAAVIYSQPKLSYTAYPILPVEDRTYRYPNALIPDFSRPSAGGVRCRGIAAIC